MAQDRAKFTMADQYFILFYLFILFYFIIIIYYLFYFSNSVKCPCNVIHDSVTLIFTFLIINNNNNLVFKVTLYFDAEYLING